MHQQVIARIFFPANVFRYSGGHRDRRYPGRADQRIDLSAGQFIHDLCRQQTADRAEAEGEQTERNDGQRINRQHGRTDRLTSDRNAEKDRDRIHQPVLRLRGKPIDDTALAHQVAEHEHTEQRNGIR